MQEYLKNLGIELKIAGLFFFIVAGLCAMLSAQVSERNLYKERGRWGYLNGAEQIVIPARFHSATSFSLGRATVEYKGKWGQIDTNGHRIIPIRYDDPYFIPDENGIILVSRGRKKGAIDTTGRIIIPVKYDQVFPYWRGMGRVKRAGKMGYLDTSGKWVIPLIFDSLTPVYGENTILAENAGKWGILGMNGQQFTDIKFDSLERTPSSSVFLAFSQGKTGYVDTLGNEVFTYKKELLPDPGRFKDFEVLSEAVHSLEKCNDAKIIQQERAIEIAGNVGIRAEIKKNDHLECQLDLWDNMCCWRLCLISTSTTREGECRFTNGCTAVLTRTIWISSDSGEILHSDTQRRLYPNYE
ncbi:MAG: WG repeat-containing protein [Bacteroidia bacterium]